MKKIVVLLLVFAIAFSFTGCINKKSEAVLDTESKISNLGVITAESGNIIDEASQAYDNLTEEEKLQIDTELLDKLNAAVAEYDNIVSVAILDEIQNAAEMTLADAYEKAFSIDTTNEELLQLQKDLEDLTSCEGIFYYKNYKAEVVFYLQYGEYWFDINYQNYMGAISEEKVLRDGENGFLFKGETTGVHINKLTGSLMNMDFEIRFGAKKMYIAWGSSENYLSRSEQQ